LLAAEAARAQGRGAQRALLSRLREAALRGEINVARRDVILEMASSAGLDMERFCLDFDAPETLRAVERSRCQAMRHGVRAVPAVVLGGEWLISGVRELHEYREVLLHFLERCGAGQSPRLLN
jgi:predicted DsbA family dithiol-disulfide isomerase